MGRLLFFVVPLLLLTSYASISRSAETEKGRYAIEVVTVDAGRELFARWGHISIVVFDRVDKSRTAYNFGTFDFDDPALRFRYALGYLNYWLETVPYGPMIRYYKIQHRGVISRTLHLTETQTEEVVRRLETNALPENRTYAYRHYLDNCCTRIRNLLNNVLGGAIKKQFDTEPTGRSYRYYTRRALKGLPVMRNVILFILGRPIDIPVTRWDEQFLPEVFGEDLDTVTIGPDHTPLVSDRRVFLEQTGPKVGEATSNVEVAIFSTYSVLLILGLAIPIVFSKKRWSWTRRLAGLGIFLWGFLAGFGGLLVIFLWTATVHYDCHSNENVLVFPVLHLWLIGPAMKLLIKGKLGARTNLWLQRYLIGATVLLAVNLLLKLGPFFQKNYEFIGVAAVMNIAVILVLRGLSITEKKQLDEKRST